MAPRIEARSLRKTFGPINAVDDVSVTVEAGEVLGFLGPNGAGKSTTMRMLTGYLSPDAGQVSICGHDMAAHPVRAKASIGYLPEGAPLYPEMTPSSLLDFAARVHGLDKASRTARLAAVADQVRLREVWRQPVETLSKGFKRRLGLALALVHDPPVLVLDEPTDGLDPNQKGEVRQLVRDMARDKAIVLSTHILEEVTAVCTRVAVIARGRIVADARPRELEAMSTLHNAVSLLVGRDAAEGLAARLALLESVARVDSVEEDAAVRLTVVARPGRSPLGEVASLLQREGTAVRELRQEAGRLDEVFRNLTAGDAGSA